jgi:hypothetical protein
MFVGVREGKRFYERMDDVKWWYKKRQFAGLGRCIYQGLKLVVNTNEKKFKFLVEKFSNRYIILVTQVNGQGCFS